MPSEQYLFRRHYVWGLTVVQPKYILHIVQTSFAVYPNCGADGTNGKRHAAAGVVGDFTRSPSVAKRAVWSPTMSPGADGSKADGGRIARNSVDFTAVNSALFESRPSAQTMTSPMRNAVPLGAYRLCGGGDLQ